MSYPYVKPLYGTSDVLASTLVVESMSVDQVWTAVHLAAAHSHAGMVKCLLEGKVFGVDDKDDQMGSL